MRQPVRCARSGLWLARYRGPDGRVRQIGRFARKHDAQAAIAAATAAAEGASMSSDLSVCEFFELWPERFPRHPHTIETNRVRIKLYVLPNLPCRGNLPLRDLRRAMLRDAQAALLRRGLAKETIDGAFASLSAMLSDAVDDELIATNPARGFRVRQNDPRLRPKRPQRERRAIPPDELAGFLDAVEPCWRSLCWTPFLTGARPGELFAIRREEVDPGAQLVYLHQTADRYGRIESGLKTTHHVRERERRGRFTLFPAALSAMLAERPASISGWLFPTRRDRVWQQRNFYRDVWTPAQKEAGTSFTLYDARHTFSSRLLAAGIPLVEVAAWMGHSLRAGGAELNTTTRTYAHATGEHRERALAELERLVALVRRSTGDRQATGEAQHA